MRYVPPTKHFFEYRGKVYTIRQLSEAFNIEYYLLRGRLIQEGWSVHEALTLGLREHRTIKKKKVDAGIRTWKRMMFRFLRHDRQLRLNSYKQLKRDFEKQYLKVA